MVRQFGVLLYCHAREDDRSLHTWYGHANLGIANVFLSGQGAVDGGRTRLASGDDAVSVGWSFILGHLSRSTRSRFDNSIVHVVSPLRVCGWIRGVMHVAEKLGRS